MNNIYKDRTPPKFLCGLGFGCPAIFETLDGSYIIIGKSTGLELPPHIRSRIGPQETVIEIPKALLSEVLK